MTWTQLAGFLPGRELALRREEGNNLRKYPMRTIDVVTFAAVGSHANLIDLSSSANPNFPLKSEAGLV